VSRAQYPEIPPRVEYQLTSAGLALESVIAEMDRWSREFPADPAARGAVRREWADRRAVPWKPRPGVQRNT